MKANGSLNRNQSSSNSNHSFLGNKLFLAYKVFLFHFLYLLIYLECLPSHYFSEKFFYMSGFDKKIFNGSKLTGRWLSSLALMAHHKSSPKMSPYPDKTRPLTVSRTCLLSCKHSHYSLSWRIIILPSWLMFTEHLLGAKCLFYLVLTIILWRMNYYSNFRFQNTEA